MSTLLDQAVEEQLTPEGEQSSPETLTSETAQAQATEQVMSPWFYADGIAGEGDKPEWFNADKYKSIADQAKAQRDLEKKLGGFKGAPEEYELSAFEDSPVKIDKENLTYKKFAETAKNLNVSQDAFDQLVGLYLDDMTARLPNPEEELKKLGETGTQQLTNLSSWASNHLSEDEFQVFAGMLTSAENVKVFQKLRQLTAEPKTPGVNEAQAYAPAMTKEKIQTLIADPRYKTDKDYRDEVQKKIAQFVGE